MNKKVGLRSASMRNVQLENNSNLGSSVITMPINPWNPTSYSIGKLAYSIPNKKAYHPFCFSVKGQDLDTYNNTETSDYKPYLFFEEDKNAFPQQNIFTGYHFPGDKNAFFRIIHLENEFSNSFFFNTQSFNKNGEITINRLHLFRFFDDTNCGCGLATNKGKIYCPGSNSSAYNQSGAYPANPGAVILIDRSSEINSVSSKKPQYVTRPLSNAIIDYCKKKGITTKQLMPNIIWDEELREY
jgi:hypothetical protein